MSKTIFQAGLQTGITTTANITQYFFPGGQGATASSTEAPRQISFHTPGVLSGLYIRITASTTNAATTIRTRINGANGNQSVSPGTAATGVFEDTTNTDTIADGDLVAIQAVAAPTGTLTMTNISQIFDVPGKATAVTKMVTNPASITGGSGFFCVVYGGQNETLGIEDDVKYQVPRGGTFVNLAVYVLGNTRTADSNVKSRVDGANGKLVVTIPTTTSGLFEDTTNRDLIPKGGVTDYDYVINAGGTGTITVQSISTEFMCYNDGLCIIGVSTNVPYNQGTTNYAPMQGRLSGELTEADTQVRARIACNASRLSVSVRTNNVANASTISFRVNGASAVATSIPSATTGVFENITDFATVAVDDLINYRVVMGAGAGGTQVTLAWIGVAMEFIGRMKEFGGSFQLGKGQPIFGS